MSNEQSYYIVIPGPVRADKRLNAEQKFLYGEIAAKCNVTGYCWATNATLCDLLGCTLRTLQRNLLELKRTGHIHVELEGQERRIWLMDGHHPQHAAAASSAKVANYDTGTGQKFHITPVKNGTHNTLTEYSNEIILTTENVCASEFEGVIWPWETETFWQAWVEWREYKLKQHRFRFKVKSSEQAALNLLQELAGGSEALAHAIMRQSRGNGWKGFHELKIQSNATHQQAAGAGGGRQGTSELRNRANEEY